MCGATASSFAGKRCLLGIVLVLGSAIAASASAALAAEDWAQYKFDARHSGNVPDRDVAPADPGP